MFEILPMFNKTVITSASARAIGILRFGHNWPTGRADVGWQRSISYMCLALV